MFVLYTRLVTNVWYIGMSNKLLIFKLLFFHNTIIHLYVKINVI